jgi:hypothetical protein
MLPSSGTLLSRREAVLTALLTGLGGVTLQADAAPEKPLTEPFLISFEFLLLVDSQGNFRKLETDGGDVLQAWAERLFQAQSTLDLFKLDENTWAVEGKARIEGTATYQGADPVPYCNDDERLVINEWVRFSI